jgi:hypothetical protein
LSENGETLSLRSPAGTGYVEEETFGASENGVAFGRYQKSTGAFNFVAMSSITPGAGFEGAANAYPKVDQIVINEIMYNPENNSAAEYVELLNISGSPADLYGDSDEPWQFIDDPDDETPGIEFYLPHVTIGTGGYYLLIKNLAAFTAEYGAPVCDYAVWGSGSLGNGGEKPQISMPGDLDGDERKYIRVDLVNYGNGLDDDPWPANANGLGDCLQRKVADDYGNDVVNWEAASATPGS